MPWINLRDSILGNTVRRSIPDELSSFRSDFKSSDILTNPIFWQYIAAVINQPYEDLPLTDPMCQYTTHIERAGVDVTVCRSNHDIAHAIRKLSYARQLMVLLNHPQNKHREYLPISTQELNLFFLLIFLERAGRTNEYSSSHDDTIMERTAAIFTTVATLLESPPDLITKYTNILTNKALDAPKNECSFFNHGFLRRQCAFLYYFVNAVHHLDLLRCRPTIDVQTWLTKDLKKLTRPQQHYPIDEAVTTLISFAETACARTGTHYEASTGAILSDNQEAKAFCVKYPGEVITILLEGVVSMVDEQKNSQDHALGTQPAQPMRL